MARNLLEKAGRIQLPDARPAGQESAAPAAKPKTAPGTLMGFMASQSTVVQQNETLRTQLAHFEGALPVRKIDARLVRASEWANRHDASFETVEFAEFRAEIQAAGGNVQPIKVRPLAAAGGLDGPTGPAVQGVGRSNGEGDGTTYEIVFGHRRHRACLDLGLPVLALIEPASEQQLFVEMERENRNRADLTAWEQGVMYARALDKGLYPSNRQLAAAIGRDLGDVGKAISLARLPKPILDAFASPLDLQFRWAKPLTDAQQSDPDGLMTRAKQLKGKGVTLGAKAVFEALTGTGRADQPSPKRELVADGKVLGTMSTDGAGRVTVKLAVGISEPLRDELAKLIEDFGQRRISEQ